MTYVVALLDNMEVVYEEDDWRSKFKSRIDRFGEARKRNFHTDVEFIVGEGDSAETFYGHKIFLACSSPVFEAMFYGPLAETKNPITIVDIKPKGFEILLKYLYVEPVDFISIVHAAEAYFAADKYLVPRLKTEIESYISRTPIENSNQFWGLTMFENFFLVPAIKKKCMKYFSKNANHLLKSVLLLNLPLDVMREIVQLDHLNVSEYRLLCAVSSWGKGSTRAETRSKMESLLPYIRFSCLTAKEFCNFHQSHRGFMRLGNTLAILKYLCNPSKFKLPEWCCQKTEKRNTRKRISPPNPIYL